MTAGERLVLAHGFTQTGRSWSVPAAELRRLLPAAEIISVDLPGHGAASDVRTDLWGSAEHLVREGGRGIHVGYSMGGRTALHAALTRPDAVDRLVLIGATAGIDDPIERMERREADERLAERIEAIGVEAFVDEWLKAPLFAGLTEETAMREDRHRNTAAGLASSLRLAGTGTQEPLWGRLREVDVPVLVLVGEHDAKFRALGERLIGGLPDADLFVVADSGHSVHLEQPAATAGAISDWLS